MTHVSKTKTSQKNLDNNISICSSNRKNGAVDMQLNTRKVLQKKLLIISSQTSKQKIRTNDCSRQKFQANVNARDKANK